MSSIGSGMSWVSVRRVQCALNAHGAHLSVDGAWGPNTDAAMSDFVSSSFDYGYTYPPDGSAVVQVTPALDHVLQCPAVTAEAPVYVPVASFPWVWLALGVATLAGGYVWWRYA